MKKTNYNLILKAIFPIGVLLFFILLSELRTEGNFGGLIGGFKVLFFLIAGAGIFLFTLIKNIGRIRKGKNIKESKIVLTVLVISTLIGVSSFWFPYDFFDKEPEFIATDVIGNKLTLADGSYMLKTREIEWTTIRRGKYQINSDTIKLDIDKERYLAKRAIKYLIQDENLIPIYSDGIETDSTGFLKIIRKIKN
ncbi:hypothetical protein DFQ11_1186 [Winogradskyella epiphytica]|uniref:Uncharacterized protein n=1 Tax=Winogradskyella epiphytica TaxID=262005 RepID=A0A2V4XBW0_9FLAO|nr:hypothetical protein [Winogradskyella epiphytica]PYE78789.1 hypothetical protein DFQ11_1186 [Winogradskyella epiphytica]